MPLTKFLTWFYSLNTVLKYLSILLLIFIVGLADYLTPKEMNFRLFYLIPLFLTAWEGKGLIAGFIFSFLSTLANFYTEYLVDNIVLHGFFLVWEFVIVMGFFVLFVITIAIIKKNNQLLHEKNEELKKANEVKEDLIRIASHDLKNPLQNIMSLSVLLKDSINKDKEETENFTSLIHESSEKMLNIIDEYLSSKRFIDSEIKAVLKPFEVDKMLAVLVSANKQNALRKNITLNFSVHKENLIVLADKTHAYEVFDNLISNAIKYSPKGKNVWINTNSQVIPEFNSDKECIVVTIKDEGPGFTEKDKQNIFNKDMKLSAVPTGGESSSGNGLYIVKQLVEAMNGRIWYESVHGKGTSFHVAFRKSK